eukprot:TRINITY_DN4502_c0_g1_i1.p1 TRINITY_DN4502_c0_g1~~TRINITY_DN4502_c0_g1_i1.p1  ORF type:complete len:272 (-),score=56.86 TRINITY_DN4502_c0_g1_i1:352-1167(-)
MSLFAGKRHSAVAALAPLDSTRAGKTRKPHMSRRAPLEKNLDALLNTHTIDKRDRSFEDAARQFKDLQASFKAAMKEPRRELSGLKKSSELKPIDYGLPKQYKLGKSSPLPQLPSAGGLREKQSFGSTVGSKFSVLPGITAKPKPPCPQSMEEVEKMLPLEFFELKQMMTLHEDLKSQMASNRAKLTEFKDAEGEDGGVLKLLREQATHVVGMMKDVLTRLESYPEELWALYGTVEAFEGCVNGQDEQSLPELYNQILLHVQAFLVQSNPS